MAAKVVEPVVSDEDIAALGSYVPKPVALLQARRAFDYADRHYERGQEFDHPDADSRRIRQMISAGLITDPVEVALAVR